MGSCGNNFFISTRYGCIHPWEPLGIGVVLCCCCCFNVGVQTHPKLEFLVYYFRESMVSKTEGKVLTVQLLNVSCAMCAMCIQDLTSQVSMETDPVVLLPKVVSLLYLKVS